MRKLLILLLFPLAVYSQTDTTIVIGGLAGKAPAFFVDTATNQTVSGKKTFSEDLLISGSSLRITDATGADSARIFDDGDTTRFTSDNPIKIGNGSLIIGVDGSVSASGKMLHGLGTITANTRNEFSNFQNNLGLLIKPRAAGTGDRFEIRDENDNVEFAVKDGGNVHIGNLILSGNLFSSSTGDIDITTGSGGVFKFDDNALHAGLDGSNQLELGHGGSNAFINNTGAGGIDMRWLGVTKLEFKSIGHIHMISDVDEKHNLTIRTFDNTKSTGIALQNSGLAYTGAIFREDVGSNKADLVFVAGQDVNIDLLTESFRIHGSTAEEGKLEVVGDFQITSGNPGANKVLTSDATGNATWVLSSGGGWTDGGANVFLTTVTDKVGIGEAGPDTKLHVSGGSAGTITPAVGTMATLENSANTYLSILSPDANERGIFFGEPTSSLAGAIIYNNSTTLDGLQFRTNNNNTRMVIASDGKVGIGTTSPNVELDVRGPGGTSVGGFPSGAMHVTSTLASINSNAVITGHNLFGGNKQLWYLGSTSSSNDNIALINRQNAELHLHTNDINRFTIQADGDIGIGTAPDASSILDISSITKGLLPPRMTTAQIDAISSPATGLVAFDTDRDMLRINKTSGWQYVTTGNIQGQFSGLNNQAPTTKTPIVLTFEANDITLEGLSHSTTVNPGEFTADIKSTFTWQVAPQWQKTTASGTDTLDFFVQTDTGTGFLTITNSNVAVISNEIESNVIFLSISVPMDVGDKIRFMFRSSNPPNLRTVTFPVRGTVPVTPSQICNVFSGN